MSVDGIGKGGGVGPGGAPGGLDPSGASSVSEANSSSGASATDAATEIGAEFSLEAAGPTADVGQVAQPSELDRLEAGQIDLEQYLDAQVDGALSHLRDKLEPAQLDEVRAQLKEELRGDPVLVELVRRTTGQSLS